MDRNGVGHRPGRRGGGGGGSSGDIVCRRRSGHTAHWDGAKIAGSYRGCLLAVASASRRSGHQEVKNDAVKRTGPREGLPAGRSASKGQITRSGVVWLSASRLVLRIFIYGRPTY